MTAIVLDPLSWTSATNAAAQLGWHPSFVTTFCEDRKIPVKKIGRHVMVRLQDIYNAIEQDGTTSARGRISTAIAVGPVATDKNGKQKKVHWPSSEHQIGGPESREGFGTEGIQ